MPNILVTGITGFLGSHIAEQLIEAKYTVVGLKRPESSTWRCKSFHSKIHWIDLNDNYTVELLNLQIDTIIHCAWIGVEAGERDDWPLQLTNIKFLLDLLQFAKKSKISRFVCLGSQAEYGVINEPIDESFETNPLTSYGSIKLACLQILKSYCSCYDINWVWLRIFSIFGEKESMNWLIPSLIRSMKTDSEMSFSPGEQQYAYLYVRDFAKILLSIYESDIESGVYNVSGDDIYSIKRLIIEIRDRINPRFKLNFGKLNYRDNQSMYIAGNTEKLSSQIGRQNYTDFAVALEKTINYYQNTNL